MIAPTLLIGLGGTGSKIVCRVSKMVTEEQRRRIGFAVFDTDVNELREIQEANPFIAVIQTSTKLSVGEYLNIDTYARDNWFPVNSILNSKTLTEGAGQVRAISRLALDTAIRANLMTPLHKCIENLYKLEEDQTSQALRVIIVSSLAGGTGSGLILPVALYLRNYLATRFQQSANITRGFFILPEVFYEVIHGSAEQNNLKCNAYATLRELDAFLMKGDGTLPARFEKSVRLEFPRTGSENHEEYQVRPYDFCFLFDAQNTEGKKLNDFNQYLDHAANCIYAQSIGPMNKRSNSSEDNTIRALAREHGRNRYAGAGCSMLIYPFEEVREYVAIKWTQQCVSNEWLRFDKMYSDKKNKQSEMREQGILVGDTIRGDDYIMTIESLANQRDPFAKTMQNQCMRYGNDGLEVLGNKWDEYIRELKKFVENEAKNQSDLDSQRDASLARLSDVEGDPDTYPKLQDAIREIMKYYNMVERKCDDKASTIAYTIFQGQSTNVTAESRGYQLESYLRDGSGAFMHPNAVRYFLYQAKNRFVQEQKVNDNRLKELNDAFGKDGIEAILDDPNTDEVENIDNLADRKRSLRDKLKNAMGKLTDDQEDMKASFQGLITKADELRVVGILKYVFKEGLDYLNGLIEAFERFYDNFEQKVNGMSKRLAEISKKCTNQPGKTTRYVCSSTICLNRMVEKLAYKGSVVSVDSRLADEIYSKVRGYAMAKDKPKNAFETIFDEGIIGYFKKQMMETYGSKIDMNIMDALEREVELESGETDMPQVMLDQRVKQIIENTRDMSKPFIERPMGEEVAPISACTYNPSLDPKDDSPRSSFIHRELSNYGGTPDDDISRYTIMFYQSIYSLRANRLSKFSPSISSVDGQAGEYFRAYYELVNQITPMSNKTPVITPHIDCRWHVVANMPDLDDGNQKRIETRIYKAFMLGLLYHVIDCGKTARGRILYKLRLSGCAPEEFVVSNKTPCDEFYEVLDALTINPVIVNQIMEDAERRLKREIIAKTSFERSMLYKMIKSLVLEQYPMFKQITLFDLCTLLKVSTPSANFDNATGIDIMRAMFDTVYDYMTKIMPQSEVEVAYGKFLNEQYNLFEKNLVNYRNIQDCEGVATDCLKNCDFVDFVDDMVLALNHILETLELDSTRDEIETRWHLKKRGIRELTEPAESSESVLNSSDEAALNLNPDDGWQV